MIARRRTKFVLVLTPEVFDDDQRLHEAVDVPLLARPEARRFGPAIVRAQEQLRRVAPEARRAYGRIE